MFCGSFEPNDFEVGVKDGKLFIMGMSYCCHGNVTNHSTMWFTPKLAEKLKTLINQEEMTTPNNRWEQNHN